MDQSVFNQFMEQMSDELVKFNKELMNKIEKFHDENCDIAEPRKEECKMNWMATIPIVVQQRASQKLIDELQDIVTDTTTIDPTLN